MYPNFISNHRGNDAVKAVRRNFITGRPHAPVGVIASVELVGGEVFSAVQGVNAMALFSPALCKAGLRLVDGIAQGICGRQPRSIRWADIADFVEMARFIGITRHSIPGTKARTIECLIVGPKIQATRIQLGSRDNNPLSRLLRNYDAEHLVSISADNPAVFSGGILHLPDEVLDLATAG